MVDSVPWSQDRRVSVYNWGGAVVDHVDLSERVFCSPIRHDVLARVVRWQLAKRRSGNHKTKGVSEVSGTTRKPYKQKGTGRARQGSLRSSQMRGGGIIFGPVVRSHRYDLPKKVRQLGMRSALSSRFSLGNLHVFEDAPFSSSKTKDLLFMLKNIFPSEGGHSVLMVLGDTLCDSLVRASSNLVRVDVLPQQGINVYDILRHDVLMLSRQALKHLEGRLSI